MFYLNSTLNFGIPPVLVFQLEDYSEVDRFLTGLAAQQKRTTARWYSNKTSLYHIANPIELTKKKTGILSLLFKIFRGRMFWVLSFLLFCEKITYRIGKTFHSSSSSKFKRETYQFCF